MFWSRINNNRQIGTAMIWQSICFALCFFSFMMAEAMTNSRAAELLGAEYVNTVYAIGLLCTGIGFLSFSALRRLFKSERLRKGCNLHCWHCLHRILLCFPHNKSYWIICLICRDCSGVLRPYRRLRVLSSRNDFFGKPIYRAIHGYRNVNSNFITNSDT